MAATGRIIFIGRIGSDAGGWYIGPDGKIHRIPGWEPDQLRDASHALAALREVSQIKASGVAERTIGGLLEMVKKDLASHIKEGDVVVLGG
jgi:hypothetical protein